ncbi:ankyrin repeat-containing protein [Planoprotostelium fungivorum]|uniref:Ankyrin repeat-containing protein n=1 Tax=Planoprotostelium fungivorum TaxID=1890364 RepID=A0A2P6NHY3_9EUKA|nr:ankyrin repeat-containing protein [Planoprotostelium fungivorum]
MEWGDQIQNALQRQSKIESQARERRDRIIILAAQEQAITQLKERISTALTHQRKNKEEVVYDEMTQYISEIRAQIEKVMNEGQQQQQEQSGISPSSSQSDIFGSNSRRHTIAPSTERADLQTSSGGKVNRLFDLFRGLSEDKDTSSNSFISAKKKQPPPIPPSLSLKEAKKSSNKLTTPERPPRPVTLSGGTSKTYLKQSKSIDNLSNIKSEAQAYTNQNPSEEFSDSPRLLRSRSYTHQSPDRVASNGSGTTHHNIVNASITAARPHKQSGYESEEEDSPIMIVDDLSQKGLSQRQMRIVKGRLYLRITSASQLYTKTPGTTNAYCVLNFNGKSCRTKVAKLTEDPVWTDEIFQFDVDEHSSSEIFIDVYNYHKFSASKRIGRTVLSVLELIEEHEFDRYLALYPVKETEHATGGVHVSIRFSNDTTTKEEEAAPDQTQILFSAIQNSEMPILNQILSEKIDPNVKDRYGFSLLHAACMVYSEYDEEILMRILNLPGIDIQAVNNDGNTPLHYLGAYFRNPNCSRPFDFMMKKGAELNAKNHFGETPLHKTLFNNSIKMIVMDLMLQAGAQVNAVNDTNETPLYYAVRNQAGVDCVKLLLRHGADPSIKNSRDNKTALDLASEYPNPDVKNTMERSLQIAKWLDSIGMERYLNNFLKKYSSLDAITGQDSIDLELDLGILMLSHQNTISKAINRMKEERRKTVLQWASSNSPSQTFVLQAPSHDSEDERDKSVSSPPNPQTSPPAVPANNQITEEESNWQKELAKLEYIKNHSSWMLNSKDIEYTVKLGEGSFGDVFKGLYRGKQEVAVKVLRKKPELLEEFKKEFQINCRIRSPYIVIFLGVCLGPKTCIVMEYCSKGSLYSFMKDPQYTFGWEQFFRASKEILLGLNYLHAHKPQILHRDMKSPNLMVTADGTVKLADFGTSRFNVSSEQNTLVQVRGSKAYTSPELFFGQPFTVRSDIFSVSIILWEMLLRVLKGVWQAPYSEYTHLRHDYQIYYQVSKMNKRNSIPDVCPSSITNLITSSWSPDPQERPDTEGALGSISEIQEEYKRNEKTWKKLVGSLRPPAKSPPQR